MTQRLDRELVRRGLARSRTHARTMISAGQVVVDGTVVERPGDQVPPSATIEAPTDRYVSRGAYKLIGALDDLQLSVAGRALDAGASTGGFTQVLLERGCQQVIALDVGSGQLAPMLRADSRVWLLERTNLRDLRLDDLGGVPVDLVVADVSFITLTLLISPLISVTRADGWLLLLVKPQFEVGRELLGKGGVVRSPAHHVQAISAVIKAAGEYGWNCVAAVPSRLQGASGNREFFILLRRTESPAHLDLEALVKT
ncbi:MAG TPA: TlyA family RNA methyltransferase [Propionibacteriaceae bacterium]|nr:TlyA family RNA methyltransferase [Propionibacteriaceae bacterium]